MQAQAAVETFRGAVVLTPLEFVKTQCKPKRLLRLQGTGPSRQPPAWSKNSMQAQAAVETPSMTSRYRWRQCQVKTQYKPKRLLRPIAAIACTSSNIPP